MTSIVVLFWSNGISPNSSNLVMFFGDCALMFQPGPRATRWRRGIMVVSHDAQTERLRILPWLFQSNIKNSDEILNSQINHCLDREAGVVWGPARPPYQAAHLQQHQLHLQHQQHQALLGTVPAVDFLKTQDE